MPTLRLATAGALLALAGACAAPTTAAPPADPAAVVDSSTTTVPKATGSLELGPAERPAQLVAPDEVTGLAPLVVLLHGYSSAAARHDTYLGVTAQAASRGLYVLLPDGTPEPGGKRFWDAGPACCNFTGVPVDDVGYLSGLIAQAVEERPIDPDRVYLFGHSNGGFMAYRMACEAADLVTAVAVLAGADGPEADDCDPTRPVSALHLHGTADYTISYDGGAVAAPFPGAVESVARWAARGGCDPTPVAGEALDLDGSIDGPETAVTTYRGCDAGIDVQLDTLEGGGHSPPLIKDRVGTDVLDWLLAHSR